MLIERNLEISEENADEYIASWTQFCNPQPLSRYKKRWWRDNPLQRLANDFGLKGAEVWTVIGEIDRLRRMHKKA